MQSVMRSDGTRFPTKKALREAIAEDPYEVVIEATSLFNNEYGGPVVFMDDDLAITVVGPSPEKRKWYATIVRKNGKWRVT